MQEIVKRLKLINSCIELNDLDIIELQMNKLEQCQPSTEVKEIIGMLERSDFSSAAVAIEEYISQLAGVEIYQDQELQGLKLELRVLEQEVQKKSSRRDTFLLEIEEFHIQYQLRLGALITTILELEKKVLQNKKEQAEKLFNKARQEFSQARAALDKLKEEQNRLEQELQELDEFDDEYDELYEEVKKVREQVAEYEEELEGKRQEAKQAKEEVNDPEREQQYQRVDEDYRQFYEEYSKTEQQEQEKPELSAQEKDELKQLFRRGAKLSHPDTVPDEEQEKAKAMMQQLNEAYAQNNLGRLQELVTSLEGDGALTTVSDSVTDKELLREKIDSLRNRLQEIEKELMEIQKDELFQTINSPEAWELYFAEQELALRDKLKNLSAKT